MKKRTFLAGAMALALAGGAVLVPSVADAATIHGGGGHGGGFHGGGGHGGGGYRVGANRGGGYRGGVATASHDDVVDAETVVTRVFRVAAPTQKDLQTGAKSIGIIISTGTWTSPR